MIQGILKDYKSLYANFHKVGMSYSDKDLLKQDSSNYFDKSLWKHFAKNGIHGLFSDSKFGGKGFSTLEGCVAIEALASACNNNGIIFSSIAHISACVFPVLNYGTIQQKDKYLKKLCSGQWIAANAITESGSGSDVYNMLTTAVKKGNSYVLNGEKLYITNAPIADVLIVYALTDKTKGFFGGISCFLVETKAKGVKITTAKNKMGLKTAQMGDVKLKDVVVNTNQLIGQVGAGGPIFNASMVLERVMVSAFLAGQLERVLTDTVSFAKSRKVNKNNLLAFQNVQHTIANIKTVLAAGKNLVYEAAMAIDSKSKHAMVKSSMAKLFVSENVVNSIKQLQELHGAHGYLSESGIEREYRDSFASLIYSGTSSIQRNIIASDL